ncbi:MAG: hypothetical protein AAGK77_13355 [Pseudomonadota bacterium]
MAARDDQRYSYLKLSYQKKGPLLCARSSFAVIFCDWLDQAVNGASWETERIFAVQKVEKIKSAFFAGIPTSAAETPTEQFQNIDLVQVSARYRFRHVGPLDTR